MSRSARAAARAWESTERGPSRWPAGPPVEKVVPMDMPTRIIPQGLHRDQRPGSDHVLNRADCNGRGMCLHRSGSLQFTAQFTTATIGAEDNKVMEKGADDLVDELRRTYSALGPCDRRAA